MKFLCSFLFLLAVLKSNKSDGEVQRNCTTPDGISGKCIPTHQCLKIVGIVNKSNLAGKRLHEDIQYIRNSFCGDHNNPRMVCCANDYDKGLQILNNQKCGEFGEHHIIKGREVKHGSRPWMALLQYRVLENLQFLCGGTLITDRFILTAAHCIRTGFDLISVRLGEHNLATEQDCYQIGKRRKCMPEVENIGIKRVFRHERFFNNYNDIALLELERPVEFKAHIRPICLPLNGTLKQEAESTPVFHVTGWGKTENGTSSDKLLEAIISNQNRTECAKTFHAEIRSTQLCAGDDASDTCKGDSGGPLVYMANYLDDLHMVQFGIVSYGAPQCGNGVPAVYTNVGSFIPWILEIVGAQS